MKLRSGIFSAVLLSAALFSSAALAELAYTVGSLNVRTGPGPGYPRVATLPGGYAVDIRACSGAWCRVNAAGITGWTSARYLSVGSAPTPVAPSYSTSTVIIGGGDPFWDDDDDGFWSPGPGWGPPPYWHRHRPWGPGPFWGGPRWPAGPRWGRPSFGGPGPAFPPPWRGGGPNTSSPASRR